MSTVYIGWINRFQGLSTDAKPATAQEGSTFFELDTQKEFIFHDGTWHEWRDHS